MPEKRTRKRAQAAKRAGKSPSTQAGEYVREEIHHVREGKHGARSTEQAIAIGLSKARRSGVRLPAPEKGEASASTRKQARRDLAKGRKRTTRKSAASRARARGAKKALKGAGRKAASRKALSRHARAAARRRTASERSGSARKGARSRSASQRSASARKAARTRARRGH